MCVKQHHRVTQHAMLVLPASSNRMSADESQYMDILNSHTTAWPGLCCWWCTNPIPADKQPIPMIHQIVRSAWAIPNIHRQAGFNLHKHGFFCCAGCVKAFCVSRSISFSPTRMWIAGCHTPDGSRINAGLGWREGHVVIAPNYLEQPKFGPGTFRMQTTPMKRRTVEIIKPIASWSAAGCPQCEKRRANASRRKINQDRRLSEAGMAIATPSSALALRRKNNRFIGKGTLSHWIDAKESGA
jgi:hypothetical protein